MSIVSTPRALAKEAAQLTENQRNFAECRVLGHSWVHLGNAGEGAQRFSAYGFVSRCSHCSTLRTKWIVGSGASAKVSYRYPKGYATHGDDRLTGVQWRRVLIVKLEAA